MRGLQLFSTLKRCQMFQSHFSSVNVYLPSQARGVITTLLGNSSLSSAVRPVRFINCCLYHLAKQRSRYYSTSRETIMPSNVQFKAKRIPRKKRVPSTHDVDKEKFDVVAYSCAEKFNIPLLSAALKEQGLYNQLPLPEELKQVLYATSVNNIDNEPRRMYFFGNEGSVVFWNIPHHEQKNILRFLKDFEVNSYDENLVSQEEEQMEYLYTENETKLCGGRILLNANEKTDLAAYSFSNALTHSVKLAIWEASLETYVESVHHLEKNICDGRKVALSRSQLFRKHGELYALKHAINLRSDMLDTPDFYWDRDNLETLYRRTYNFLNMPKRIRVMNEKLRDCSELIGMLRSHFTDKHHINLEMMIIALILVEVILGCATFLATDTRFAVISS